MRGSDPSMVRDANFADIPQIMLLLHEGYLRSRYATDGRVEIDETEAKRLLFQAIQRHGHKMGGACFVQVCEAGGAIAGLILGNLSRAYAIGTKLSATDLFWFATEKAEPGDAIRLMKNMIAWARDCPNVIEIRCGTTGIIREDPEQAGVILERLGLIPDGRHWRMET